MPAHASPGERFIIRPGTPARGGKFLGDVVTVVDCDSNPDPYDQAYELVKLTNRDLQSPLVIARAVNEMVQGVIPFSKEGMATTLGYEAGGGTRLGPKDEIPLSRFMFNDGGICHQQTLLTMVTLELLQVRRGIGGEVSLWNAQSEEDPLRHTDTHYRRQGNLIIVNSHKNTVRPYNVDE